MKQNGIVLFDGNCTFCHKSVQLIMKHDSVAYFRFAALNSESGNRLREQFHIPDTLDSLVLIENNTYYTASSAALRISRKLNGIYRFAALLLLVPKPLRDAVYSIISKRRHNLLQKHACPLPTPEQQKRMLD